MAAGAVTWVAAVVLFILGGLITLWGNWCRGWYVGIGCKQAGRHE